MHSVAVQKSACLIRFFSIDENRLRLGVGLVPIPWRFFHLASRLNVFNPAADWMTSNTKCETFIADMQSIRCKSIIMISFILSVMECCIKIMVL